MPVIQQVIAIPQGALPVPQGAIAMPVPPLSMPLPAPDGSKMLANFLQGFTLLRSLFRMIILT